MADDTGDLALVDALASCSFVVMGVLTRIAAENDMSLTQLRALGILRDRRPRMAQLAEFMGLDRSTMSGLIERAEGRGLVRRVPNSDDGRAVDVVMTAAGLELAEVLAADVRAALAPLTERVDPARRAVLVEALTRMLAFEAPPA
jgi:DNA-binding MarR family transcriptional regulator